MRNPSKICRSPKFRDMAAARSAARWAVGFASQQQHTEAVADCPRCTIRFLAVWVLEVLGLESPRAIPPGPADPPRMKRHRLTRVE